MLIYFQRFADSLIILLILYTNLLCVLSTFSCYENFPTKIGNLLSLPIIFQLIQGSTWLGFLEAYWWPVRSEWCAFPDLITSPLSLKNNFWLSFSFAYCEGHISKKNFTYLFKKLHTFTSLREKIPAIAICAHNAMFLCLTNCTKFEKRSISFI